MTTELLRAEEAAAGEQTAASGWPSRVAAAVDRRLEGAGDLINPILVKETRQALKSRQFTLWFLLLLAAAWIVTIGAIALIGPSVYYTSSGGLLYFAYYVVLAFPLLVVAPFSAYRSLASEQEENTRDLLTVSALSPRQVINGKIGSALLQIGIYLSALAPCLAFTYLLRGIDLLTVFLLPAYTVAASLLLSMLGLFAASVTRKKAGQVFLSIALVAVLLGAFSWSWQAAEELIQSGHRMFQDRDFWVANLFVLTFCVTTFLLLYYAAAALNTFTAANRSTAIRVVLFVKQACAAGWMAYFYADSDYELGPPFFGAALIGIVWFVVASIASGEAPVMSNRVRRSLPTSGLAKLFATWFNPGPGAGFVFSLANWAAVVTPVAAALLVDAGPRTRDAAVFLLVGTSYAVIFLGVGRLAVVGLRRLAQVTMLGCFLINFLLLLGASAAPLLVIAWSDSPAPREFVGYYAVSPLMTLASIMNGRVSPDAMLSLTIGVPGVALCGLLVWLVHAGREARQARTPTPRRVIEDELELNPLPTPAARNPWGDT